WAPGNVGFCRSFRARLTQFLHSSQRHLFAYSPCSLFRKDETTAMVSVLRLRSSELDHYLDGFTVVHRTVAVGDTVDVRDAIEDEAWLDSAFQHVGHEFVHVGTHRRGAAGNGAAGVERRTRIPRGRLPRT